MQVNPGVRSVSRRLIPVLLLALLLAACAQGEANRGGTPAATAGPAQAPVPSPLPGSEKIKHVIVIIQENWSFDGLYGKFPGANGLANAGDAARQVDKDGKPYDTLPQPTIPGDPPKPDTRFPANLPVGPWDAGQFVPVDQKTNDLGHRFYQEQYQIDGGKMDRFVAWSSAASLAMSYYDAAGLPEGKLAQQYTLADNLFHAAYGDSFLNHFWLVCACTPVWNNAPDSIKITLDAGGQVTRDGVVTPDGYAVNTVYPSNPPERQGNDAKNTLPLQSMPTIGDRLSEKNITWAWYAGGWNDALAGKGTDMFRYHHQPFNYFANQAPGKPGREHLKDAQDFLSALMDGALPAVSFVKPLGGLDEHPGYSDLLKGQQYVADLVQAVQASRYWKDSAIIVIYDENGGRWDHVAPPKIDRWGPGTRVPMIVISPYARRGFVDHTQYDTTSILKFIESRWGLAPLSARDAQANDLGSAFDFSRP